MMTGADIESEFELLEETPYLALTGMLWAVSREEFGENLPLYNSTTMYFK